jgi:large subunit ribosomal protein L6
VECKESRIEKQPIEVPANVALTFEEKFVKATLNFLGVVKIVKEESGNLRVYMTAKTWKLQ